MRKFLINNLWCLAFGGAIFSAALFLAWSQIGIGQEQQGRHDAKDKSVLQEDSPETNHIRKVGDLCRGYAAVYKKSPAQIDDVKIWAIKEGKATEEDFVSTRDNQPYGLSAGMAPGETFVYEQTGKRGRRFVFLTGKVFELPTAEVNDRIKAFSGSRTGMLAKAAEPTLEEMLNKALKDNPDIKVAEAKVREAGAELNRTRLQVTQKVLTFHHSRESQKAVVRVAEDEVARVRKLDKANVISQQDVTQAEDRLAQAKAKLAEMEAEMPYLLGEQQGPVRSVAFDPDGRILATEGFLGEVKLWDAVTGKELARTRQRERLWSVRFSPDGKRLLATGVKPVAETTLERIRKALDTPVKLDLQAVNAAGVLKDLEKQVPGISFHVMANTGIANLHLNGPVPLAAALQLVEDTFTVPTMEGGATARCSFVIRDYGILFTTSGRIPPGAIQLDDLLKERAAAESAKKPAGNEKPSGEKK